MPTRREFLTSSVATTALAAALSADAAATSIGAPKESGAITRRRLAPRLGMFARLAGIDPVAELQFLAEHGFGGCAHLRLSHHSANEQTRLASAMRSLRLQWGAFVATESYSDPTFTSGRRELSRRVLADVDRAVETAERTGAAHAIIVPGRADARLPSAAQTSNAIDLLRRCLDRCEPARLTLLLEPLAAPGPAPMFLQTLAQAVDLCESLGSPHCRVLFDVYEQSAQDLALTDAVRQFAPHVGYVQLADFPGRKEPGAGAIDFGSLFEAFTAAKYSGLFALEHGPSRAGRRGEQAILDAYTALV